ALKGPQDAVVEMVKEYEHRRNLIVSELNKIDGVKCFKPRGAFYVFPDFSEISKDSMSLAMHILEKARVVTVPGVIFGPEIGEGHLRLSFATSRENLEKAVRRIREVVSNL
nr:aminotransferase class I/II-fold pyridoxal phosphate-dependent enzyme [Candidatus Baldrarchaeota archaeon]